MQLHSIYTLSDENGNVFYVGKSINPHKRFRRHMGHVRSGSTYPVHNKLRVVVSLIKNTEGILKILESGLSEEEADIREQHHIKSFKAAGCKLKNLTEGGEGGKGFTAEQQRLAGEKRRGMKRSHETRLRISNAKKEIPLSTDHRQALVKAWETRTPLSVEHYQMISKLNRGVINIKKYLVQDPSGNEFITENGLRDFCRTHSLTCTLLHKTLDGSRPHHRGWKIIKMLEEKN